MRYRCVAVGSWLGRGIFVNRWAWRLYQCYSLVRGQQFVVWYRVTLEIHETQCSWLCRSHTEHFPRCVCAVLDPVFINPKKKTSQKDPITKYWCSYLSTWSNIHHDPIQDLKIWKKIQDFKVCRLLLSYCEASQHVRKLRGGDMEFFQGCGKGESFREAISRLRASGMTMKQARTASGGILMPTKSLMRHIELQKFDTVEGEEACVEECRILYNCNFDAEICVWRTSWILCRISYVSHWCLSREQEVDPKLLLSSRDKGPPWCRNHPTHKPPGGRVNVHHILCAWCEHADSENTYTLCAEALCVSTASSGDGARRRQESLFCFPHYQHLSLASQQMRPDSDQGQGRK